MERSAHAALKRRIDHLMLLDTGLAPEDCRSDGRGVVIAVAGKISDLDLRVRDRGLDQVLDLAGVHGHPDRLLKRASRPCRRAAISRGRPSIPLRIWPRGS